MPDRELSFNCYGESLDTSPDFLAAKRAYEESLLNWEELEENCEKNCEQNGESDLEITEHIPNFDIPIKENLPLKQPNLNEKDVL